MFSLRNTLFPKIVLWNSTKICFFVYFFVTADYTDVAFVMLTRKYKSLLNLVSRSCLLGLIGENYSTTMYLEVSNVLCAIILEATPQPSEVAGVDTPVIERRN